MILKINIIIGTRECYCNGTWGPEPCQLALIGQVQELVCTIALKVANPLINVPLFRFQMEMLKKVLN